MISLTKSLVAIPLLIMGGALNAAEPTKKNYFDLSYGQLSYKEGGLSSLSPSVITGTLGSYIYDGLAIEGFLATGASDDSVTYSGVPVTLSVDSAYGFYLRPYLKISEGTEIYAKAGYFHGKLTASARGYNLGTSGSDFSYGIGLSAKIGGDMSIFAEYMSFYDKADIKISGVNVGVKIPF